MLREKHSDPHIPHRRNREREKRVLGFNRRREERTKESEKGKNSILIDRPESRLSDERRWSHNHTLTTIHLPSIHLPSIYFLQLLLFFKKNESQSFFFLFTIGTVQPSLHSLQLLPLLLCYYLLFTLHPISTS
jgi:hypothetical protein